MKDYRLEFYDPFTFTTTFKTIQLTDGQYTKAIKDVERKRKFRQFDKRQQIATIYELKSLTLINTTADETIQY
jgi:hypothetical protein